MKSVIDVVKRLMPKGSERAGRSKPTWTDCPWWPPDVFAVAATLVNISGCYAQPRFSASCSGNYLFGKKYLEFIEATANEWIDHIDPPKAISLLWRELIVRHGRKEITDEAWQEGAMRLMALADHASTGIGFSSKSARESAFAEAVISQHLRIIEKKRRGRNASRIPLLFPYVPASLCRMVPPSEACVQPKTVTSQVGCTLRSLTHNLALLPAEGEVASSWLIANDNAALESDALNLVLVPFPYHVDGRCFVRKQRTPTDSTKGAQHYFFALEQKWLNHGGRRITAKQLANHLVLPLIRQARREVGAVHGVVFPETALTQDIADDLAKILVKENDLELFIAGTFTERRGKLATNSVASYYFGRSRGKRELLSLSVQSKCHRWCLDESQIRRYNLGHALQPHASLWWEQIDIEERACAFHEIRRGATLTAMVCEDLARFEPIHPIVRSIGPNFVIVLLMDGPQLKNRWPAHYAGVLADDPGSAVLTLTSLGMARRSVAPGSPEPREIGLWKQPGGETQELRLPIAHQALLLTLSVHCVEHVTLDGRSDGNMTRMFELSGARGIKLKEREMDFLKSHFS